MALTSVFFNAIRPHFGGKLTPSQVNGMEAIDRAWAKYGDGNFNRYAYALATPIVETGGSYEPIHERGTKSYFNKYEPGTKLGKALGNTQPGDGFKYRGRGLVQITGRANYAKVSKEFGIDLLGNPDLALDLDLAARILVVGTMKGWFTGKGLPAYIDDVDESDAEDLKEYIQARRTVNGQDKAEKIGRDALAFEKALRQAAEVKTEHEPPLDPIVIEPADPIITKPHGTPWWVYIAIILAIVSVAVWLSSTSL